MTPEVVRRHYLEAMGITAWGSKYQLPNALPTEACEWEDAPAAAPPRERLHALLNDAPAPRVSTPPVAPRSASQRSSSINSSSINSSGVNSSDVNSSDVNSSSEQSSHVQRSYVHSESSEREATPDALVSPPSSARALLGKPPVEEGVATDSQDAAALPQTHAAKPLQFSFSCICLNERWLSLHEGDISSLEQQLLTHIMRAAGILSNNLDLRVTNFLWPPMVDAFVPEDPLEEAREGVAAFIEGAVERQGWQLERVLWWNAKQSGGASALSHVLNVNQGQSSTLALPVWQGPSLRQLAHSAEAKRLLWPELVGLRKQWQALLRD